MSKFDEFLRFMDDNTKQFTKKMQADAKEALADTARGVPYYERQREGEKTSGLVKVGHVLKLIHFMAARMVCRQIPGACLAHVIEFAAKPAARFLLLVAAELALKRLPTPGLAAHVVSELATVEAEAQLEARLEAGIRDHVAEPRVHINERMLFQTRARGKVKSIRSRHPKK